MRIAVRPYRHEDDYERVAQFLVRTYRSTGAHINWLQPRWEYMHFHPYIRRVDLGKIGVWEAEGEIVAVVHPEHCMGMAYFEIDPAHGDLKREMLDYAEEYLADTSPGAKTLRIHVNDSDDELGPIAAEMGYEVDSGGEEMTWFEITDTLPAMSMPRGFRLKSLADDNDMRKVHKVLWRGFKIVGSSFS
jgi:hypothetical protein